MVGFYELAEKALALERAGKKMTRLNIGDTNLPTPQCAIDAVISSVESEKASYCASAGLAKLREKIAKREKCEPGNVVVGPGSKHLIYALMSVLCSKGDKIGFPAPYWPMYGLASRQLGLEMQTLETGVDSGWSFNPEDIPESKVTILCNPLNPTSTIYEEKIVNEVIGRCQDRGSHLILDEAYKGLAFEKMPQYEGAIKVCSFSKEFNMEGWRLGYVVAPEHVVEKLVGYNQITATCTPPFIQEAGIACLDNEKEILAQNVKIWQSRAKTAEKVLSEHGFTFAKPEAGIYVFATHDSIKDAETYAMDLIEKEGVVVSPGTAFGGFKRFFRICVNRSEDVLTDAIGKMALQLD